jgi:hypothetical protein
MSKTLQMALGPVFVCFLFSGIFFGGDVLFFKLSGALSTAFQTRPETPQSGLRHQEPLAEVWLDLLLVKEMQEVLNFTPLY